MYLYVRYYDDLDKKYKFDIVKEECVKNYKPGKKNKKFKIIIGDQTVDGIVIFEAGKCLNNYSYLFQVSLKSYKY